MSVSISVCMPVYNGSRFLERAFDCLAHQTLRDFEVIIVNDGSSDDSADKAMQLMRQHGIAGQVITTDNHGCEQARDIACTYARGSIIAPFDCDDYWEPDYLQAMSDALTQSKVDLIYCDFVEEFPGGQQVLKSSTTTWIDLRQAGRAGSVYWFPRGTFFPLLLQGQVLFPPCTMFTKRFYETVGSYVDGLPELRISLDWSFGLRAARIGVVAFLRRPLLRKYIHTSNVSGDNFKTASADVRVLEWILAHDEHLLAEERRAAKARGAQRCLDAAYTAWAVYHLNAQARALCFRSLRFGFRARAVRLALKTCVPTVLVQKIRALRT